VKASAGLFTQEDPMPGIVAFPTVVEQALQEFGSVFANEPERVHFGEYLTGLLVASRKNVSGINAEFAVTTDQSCLNRWITEVAWDVGQLNQRRLDWLQQDPSTRYSAHGVIALDNTLINHDGKLIEDVGWLWDHADQRHVIAHDYLIANYVCTSGKHYPLEFRRFRKEEDDPATFKNHTLLFKELVDWVVQQQIPGDFTFDCYFTNAEILNHLHQQQRAYVGDLKFNRKVWFGGREMKASEVAAQIDAESRKLVTIGEQKYWYFTKTLHIPQVDHPVRLVILWERKNGAEPVKMMASNRVYWEISRILNVYRQRWTGTETFHRDGKQHLGMGDCQLRKGEGQTRHMYLVMMAHSLLVAQMRQGRASEWAHAMLTTVGEACRAIRRETLGNTITWAIDKATRASWSHDRILAHLALT
jgi:hypothetical protein